MITRKTSLIAITVLTALCSSLAAEKKPLAKYKAYYQEFVKTQKFDWNDAHTTVLHSLATLPEGYSATIHYSPLGDTLTISLIKDQTVLHTFKAHIYTAFRVVENTNRKGILYLTDYITAAAGCKLSAINLTNGNMLWQRHLNGLEPRTHYVYKNRVVMDTVRANRLTLVIKGRETFGDYIEYVFADTGETIANKRFVKKK